MAKTYNRRPLNINYPKISYEFFSHSNWKGLCVNENYYNIDQETFEDCNNVYINENAILSSRPPINVYDEYDNKNNYINVWRKNNENYYLVKRGEQHYLYYKNEVNTELSTDNIQLMFLNGEPIVFTEDGISTENLYHPVTIVYSNDILVDSKELESENVIYSGYSIRYIYTGVSHVNSYLFTGKTVNVKVNNENYNVEFKNDTYKLILNKRAELTANAYDDKGRTYIQVSNNGVILMPLKIAAGKWLIKYSLDGRVFNDVGEVTNIYGVPTLSKDGSSVAVLKSDGLYIKDLIQITGDNTYVDFTRVYENKYGNVIEYITGDYDDVPVGINFERKSRYCYVYKRDNGGYILLDTVIGQRTSISDYFYNTSNNTRLNLKYVEIKNEAGNVDQIRYYLIDVWKEGVARIAGLIYSSSDNFGTPTLYLQQLDESLMYYDYDYDVNEKHIACTYSYDNELNSYTIILDSTTNDANVTERTFDVPGKYVKLRLYDDVVVTLTDSTFYAREIDASYVPVEPNGAISNLYPLSIGDKLYFVSDKNNTTGKLFLYDNDLSDTTVIITENVKGEIKPLLFEHQAELNERYISKDDTLYISDNRYDGDKQLLYFPKNNIKKFNNTITNLHPVSKSQVGVFFENELWYVEKTEQGYAYYKSKINLGCKKGADVAVSYDGVNVIFSTVKGLTYMSYEDFVQSTDQTLTFLSDYIFTLYNDFQKEPVKLQLYRYWIFCYNTVDKFAYIFDMRNDSWWKWSFNHKLRNMTIENDKLLFITDDSDYNVYVLDSFSNSYDDNGVAIDWHFTSQKLHFNTLNYIKNVHDIIINSVQSDESGKVSFNMNIKNYRVSVSDRYSQPENIEYKVNALRTYVKHCNSSKINEFQYTLASDDENVQASPLKINSIVIKYTLGGEIK